MTSETMVVALAADHAGLPLKNQLRDALAEQGPAPLDLGVHTPDSVDYPDIARLLTDALADGRATRGVLICGTGIGVSIAANRVAHIRCAVCHDVTSARLAREHNDANVMALGARTTGPTTAIDCLRTFLETPFAGGRHARRVAKLG
ncbi:MAG: ribose 5-phosphate isomerase B [Geminicoccaceae bacterium]|nr:ribose 5-phosphate isomerase B [Geminicoccaceae bacterium]